MGAFEQKGGQKIFRTLGIAGGFGFLMAVLILLGYYVGRSLDRRFGTDPWLVLLCLFLGVVLGFAEFFRMAKRLFPSESERKNRERE